MPHILRHRYFDLSGSTLVEIHLDQYLRGIHGRYAHVKISIFDGEQADVEISPPSNHWLHTPKLLREMERLVFEEVTMAKNGRVEHDEPDARH